MSVFDWKYKEAPAEIDATLHDSIFLAGGIVGCPDWQQEIKKLLECTRQGFWIFNPRRKEFPDKDPQVKEEQKKWEYKYLNKVTAILFWFPKEMTRPTTLFQLGAHLKDDKPIFVGVHPNYPRKREVEIQIELFRPEIKIVYSLEELSQQISEASGSIRLCSQLKEDISKSEQELTILQTLYNLSQTQFPDLQRISDRWNHIRYASSLVNSKAKHAKMKHSCGCCPDAPLLVYPYIVVDGVEINSDPTGIGVGERNQWGEGEIPNKGWKEKLIKHNISSTVIDIVQQYFDDNPIVDYDDEDED